MRRAHEERPRTLKEWHRRLSPDASLQPGYFRKGRTARGCPRRCAHCLAKKSYPSLQERKSDFALQEWLELLKQGDELLRVAGLRSDGEGGPK